MKRIAEPIVKLIAYRANCKTHCPCKKRKLPMTLLEVLISLGLVMLILSFLLFSYRQLTEIDVQLEKLQKDNFHIRYVENRLMNILPKALKPITGVNVKKPYFYFFTDKEAAGMFQSGSQSLVFTFDNGVNLDKQFSYRTIGRLYVDVDGRLMLAKWPSPKYWKPTGSPSMKKEVLMENVTKLSFFFYIAPETDWVPLGKDKSIDQGKEIPAEKFHHWEPEWKTDYMRLPEMVKIVIERKVNDKIQTVEFIFRIPDAPTPIIYNQI